MKLPLPHRNPVFFIKKELFFHRLFFHLEELVLSCWRIRRGLPSCNTAMAPPVAHGQRPSAPPQDLLPYLPGVLHIVPSPILRVPSGPACMVSFKPVLALFRLKILIRWNELKEELLA